MISVQGKKFRSAAWIAAVLCLSAFVGCSNQDAVRQESTSEAASGSRQALVAGDTYFSTDLNGQETEQAWIEGQVVNMEGRYEIVQRAGHVGPPVIVDDTFKATMESCNPPEGSQWVTADGTVIDRNGEIEVFPDGTSCVYREPPSSASSVPAAAPEATEPPVVVPAPEATATSNPVAAPDTDEQASLTLEPQQLSTSTSDIVFSLPAEVKIEQVNDPIHDFVTHRYLSRFDDKLVLVEIADVSVFSTTAERQSEDEQSAELSKSEAETEADLLGVFGSFEGLERTGGGRQVFVATEAGAFAGYEVEIALKGQQGALRLFRRDGIKFVMIGFQLSPGDWDQINGSIRFESTASAS